MNERDPDLHKLYREHSREEPPSALDAAILAAAHRAVASGPRKGGAEATRPQRWWMPLAAAAAIGVVAIGIVQQAPKETAIDATSVATAPATAPSSAPVQQAPAAAAESQPAPPADVGVLAKKQKEGEAPASRTPPPVANAPKRASEEKLAAARENKVAAEPVPFPAAPALQKPAPQKTEADATKRDAPMEQSFAESRKDTARDERQVPAGAVAQAPAAAPAPAPPPASVARLRAQSDAASSAGQSGKMRNEQKNAEEDMRSLARDPDAWIVRIRKLRDDGNVAQAQRELKEFRALVPDAERRLPPDLRSLQP